jgi:hypothetical protein
MGKNKNDARHFGKYEIMQHFRKFYFPKYES